MKYDILYKEAFPLVEVKLDKGEMLKAESGAMVSMSQTIDVEGKIDGGIMQGLGRMISGEKFFFQTLAANRGYGEVLLAPAAMGSVVDIELDGSYGMCIQKDGFLAATQNVEISTKMQNLFKGLFSGEGFFILKATGRGTLFINSLGNIHAINIPSGQEAIIDNSHLVAWPDYMNYTLEKASKGWISSWTSGEGIVCRFKGPGTVLIQSRNPRAFGAWVSQFVPSKG